MIGLGWGFAVNLVFSAAIYVLALKVRLPAGHVEEIIETTPHDEVDHDEVPADDPADDGRPAGPRAADR